VAGARNVDKFDRRCMLSLHRAGIIIGDISLRSSGLRFKLVEIAGKGPVHRTLEAGAAVVTKVAG
jgi:hypothetical protein